jgi:3-(3-hydroxy-phenyl)propionate hydroxylase
MGIPIWRRFDATPLRRGPDQCVDTLIVGAGPVGLTLALDLARRSHRVTIVNKLDLIARGSKAICFSKRSLDIWDRLGIGQAMLAKGVTWNVGKVFWGGGEPPVYQFDLLPVKDQKNPAFINLQQYHVEDILQRALLAMPNVDLRWGHRVDEIDANAEDVAVGICTADGRYTIKTKWLIACDGHKSTVRELMGEDFEGRIFEDNFLIADIKVKEKRPAERSFWFNPPFNPGQSALLHKQPDDVWRLDFQLGWNIDREASVLPHNVERLVRGMLGQDAEFSEEWYSVYTFQCRRMARFVHDRVIFAGDSAHLVSPFGARGCNGGLSDADNLGWKLDLILRGEAGRSLLESFNVEAIAAADENILNSTRSTDFMTPKTEASRAFRDAVLELAKRYPFARPFVNSGRLSTAVHFPQSPLNTPDEAGADWRGIAPGAPALDAPLGTEWLLQSIGADFVLLTNGWNPGPIEGLRVLDLHTRHADTSIALERYDLSDSSAYLIRPDQYVAARWRRPTVQRIQDALSRAKGHD